MKSGMSLFLFPGRIQTRCGFVVTLRFRRPTLPLVGPTEPVVSVCSQRLQRGRALVLFRRFRKTALLQEQSAQS